MKEIKIERDENCRVSINGGLLKSQTVEANLLFAIMEKLEEIRCGLIDVEDSIRPR